MKKRMNIPDELNRFDPGQPVEETTETTPGAGASDDTAEENESPEDEG